MTLNNLLFHIILFIVAINSCPLRNIMVQCNVFSVSVPDSALFQLLDVLLWRLCVSFYIWREQWYFNSVWHKQKRISAGHGSTIVSICRRDELFTACRCHRHHHHQIANSLNARGLIRQIESVLPCAVLYIYNITHMVIRSDLHTFISAMYNSIPSF